MKQILRYQDEKSDKFWRVETDGGMMVVNWGKTGTNGRWQLTEYDTVEECERQAEKLAASKQKKGYRPMPEFDPNAQLYFDTEEYGLQPLTSHPIFRRYFSDALYYDCADEEAPFGNDAGNDTLYLLQESYKPQMNVTDFPRYLIAEEWKLTYLPPVPAQTDGELKEQAGQMIGELPGEQEILQTDQVILAAAFGQIKLTGKLETGLLELAFSSLNRMERMHRLLWGWDKPEPPHHIAIMRRDLERFAKEKA